MERPRAKEPVRLRQMAARPVMAAAQAGGNPLQSLIPIAAVGLFMYFIVIRPQYKAQKEKRQQHEALMASLKKNDRIVTIGGIIGTVAEVSGDRVTIKIDDNTRMKVLRSAVQEMLTDKSDTTDKQDSP